MSAMLTRRHLLVLSASTICYSLLKPTTAFSVPGNSNPQVTAEVFLLSKAIPLKEISGASDVAQSYQAVAKGTLTREGILSTLAAKTDWSTKESFEIKLSMMIRDDFSADRIFWHQGWLYTETEGLMTSLATLL